MNTQPTVFVVDDDDAVRDALQGLFEAVGYHVETFCDAQDFLDNYDHTRPGCLLLDVRMPGWMERNYRNIWPSIIQIFR
jgi:FixJ family two-component response regulator